MDWAEEEEEREGGWGADQAGWWHVERYLEKKELWKGLDSYEIPPAASETHCLFLSCPWCEYTCSREVQELQISWFTCSVSKRITNAQTKKDVWICCASSENRSPSQFNRCYSLINGMNFNMPPLWNMNLIHLVWQNNMAHIFCGRQKPLRNHFVYSNKVKTI